MRLHPQIVPPVLDKLERSVDLYLDINYSHVVGTILEDMKILEKPILSFDTTEHGNTGQLVFKKMKFQSWFKRLKITEEMEDS